MTNFFRIIYFNFFLGIYLCSWNLYASDTFPTGNDIYHTCGNLSSNSTPYKSTDELIKISVERGRDIGMCFSSIGAVFVAITEVGYSWAANSDFAKCMEEYYGFDQFTGEQLLDMTMKYLKEHPEIRNMSISAIMSAMIHDNFSASVCRKLIKK